jgi:hypothetical protein
MTATDTSETDTLLEGRTFRWTFEDGPTSGKTYEHKFSADGTVVWKDVTSDETADETKNESAGGEGSADAKTSNAKSSPATRKETRYAAYEIAPGIILVSYLSADSGYTLTTCMDLNSKRLHGFASSSKEWYPLTGTVEEVA